MIHKPLKYGLNLVKNRSPILHFCRSYARPNIQRPQFPHRIRGQFLELTRVQLPEDPNKDLCQHVIKSREATEQDDLLDQLMAAELLEKLEEANFIGIFERLPCKNLEFYDMRYILSQADLFYQYHSESIFEIAIRDTKYAVLKDLYNRNTVTFTAKDVDLEKVIKMTKKTPFLLLIGGIFNGQLMHVNQLQEYSKLTLPMLHSELSSILGRPAQMLSSNLNHHQTELCSSLTRYLSNDEENKDSPC